MNDQSLGVLDALPRAFAARQGVFAAWIGMAEPTIADVLARSGFDAVVLDMQHGAFDFATTNMATALAALARTPTIVRVPVGEFQMASRVLDAGAAGIIAPMINTVADARTLAAFTKYPPVGERSFGPRRVLDLCGLDGKAYVAGANALHRTFAMIETREALGLLDDILAVPGIDGVFVGPSDLSIALTNGRTIDPALPEVDAALDHVAARARAAGKHAGLFCFSGHQARAMVGRGFSLCSIATDMLLLRAAAKAELADARRAIDGT